MTLEEAFAKFLTSRGHDNLPWETGVAEARAIFDAGWLAHMDSKKQVDMFPGTISHDAPPVVQFLIDALSGTPTPFSEISKREALKHCGHAGHAAGTLKEVDVQANAIWALWPVKKAKGAAIPAIKKALKKCPYVDMRGAVDAMREAFIGWPADERQYLPMCSTWMNQERWLDDRSTWQRGAAVRPSQFSQKY